VVVKRADNFECEYFVVRKRGFRIFILTFIFWCAPFGYLYFLFFYNEPELGAEIYPGTALTPLTSSIGQGLNP